MKVLLMKKGTLMIEISEFYQNKTSAERKLEILAQIVACEKLLESDDFSIVGGACLMTCDLTSVSSSIRLAPKLSEECHIKIKKVLKDYLDRLKELQQQIEKEK